MEELSLFTYKEAINLIIGFYTFTLGFWEEELKNIPEAKRCVDLELTKRDENYDNLYVLCETGKNVFHEYIKNISEIFIGQMKTKGFEMSFTETAKWFKEKFELETYEDGEDIAEYICGNLYHYGYKAGKCHSRSKGNFYRLERINVTK